MLVGAEHHGADRVALEVEREAEVDLDPSLLGGARVQVGDQVIHASVRDALAQMAAALTR